MASARQRARRAKRQYKAVQNVIRSGQADTLPDEVVNEYVKRTNNQQKRANAERVKTQKKQESARIAERAWVNDVVSTGHQYIKGTKAPRVARTREEKALNARARSERLEREKVMSRDRDNGWMIRTGEYVKVGPSGYNPGRSGMDDVDNHPNHQKNRR